MNSVLMDLFDQLQPLPPCRMQTHVLIITAPPPPSVPLQPCCHRPPLSRSCCWGVLIRSLTSSRELLTSSHEEAAHSRMISLTCGTGILILVHKSVLRHQFIHLVIQSLCMSVSSFFCSQAPSPTCYIIYCMALWMQEVAKRLKVRIPM